LTIVLANKPQLAGVILDAFLEGEVDETSIEPLLSLAGDVELMDPIICIGVLEGDMSTSLGVFRGLLACSDHEQSMMVTLFRFGGGSMRGLAGGEGAAVRFSVIVNAGAGAGEFAEWSSDALED